jgi:D-sedoheptulose 7-phosphate isomerase
MKTVLAHGCFDRLHPGHIRHLQEARRLGDRLVVSITSDRFVNKGPGRPAFNEQERAACLLELRCVDEVKINDGPDAVGMIAHVKPSIYVKGVDYLEAKDDALALESDAVSAVGGILRYTTTTKWSSTALLSAEKPSHPFSGYLDVLRNVECDMSFDSVLDLICRVRTDHHRLFFIGNGGSAAIASHMAADFQKAAKVPSMCFNDAAHVTAWSNDVGYDTVFYAGVHMHGREGDVLFAISSSGQSRSIADVAQEAHKWGVKVITLSGFAPANRLRKLGVANFYVPSDRYGVVETAHQAILHSLLDAAVECHA